MIEHVSHTKFVEKVQDLKYLILPFVAAASGVLGELLSRPPWLYAPVNSPAQYQNIELVQPLM